MSVWLGMLGILGFIIGVILLVVSAIRKKPKKTSLMVMGISFIMFVTGVATTDTADTSESSASPKKVETKETVAEATSSSEEQATRDSIDAKIDEFNEKRKNKDNYSKEVTYDDLARTPDSFVGELVSLQGTVIQVIETDAETQLRLAVNDNYDTVAFVGYPKETVDRRVLEDDYITIYGESIGLISYDSTLGGSITVPGVKVNMIENQ